MIFSLKSQIHDFITGTEGSLDAAMKNIKYIKKYNIPLTIITNVNFDDALDISNFCKKNHFSYNIDHDIFAQKDGGKSPYDLRMTREQLMLELPNFDKLREYKPHKHNDDEYVALESRIHYLSIVTGSFIPAINFYILLATVIQNLYLIFDRL